MGTVERLIQAIESEDAEAFGALFAEDAVLHEPFFPEPSKGRVAIVEGEKALFRAFGDISIDVAQTAGSDDRLLVELTLSATNDGPLDLGDGDVPPTGRRISMPMVWSLELDADGKVVEERDYFDTGSFMRQLGFAE